MTFLRVFSILGVVVMGSAVVLGLMAGGFGEEGAAIWALLWGKVTLVDLYLGLLFFGLWVAMRETRPLVTLLWWVGLITLGNLAAALYLVVVSFTSSTINEALTGNGSSPEGIGSRERGAVS